MLAPGGDEGATGVVPDLESSLEGIGASTALFESLAGSSVMLDLYDVFANPSAFPFPPDVGADHVTCSATTSAAATPMEMDVMASASEFGAGGGFVPTCQPDAFTSSTGTCLAVTNFSCSVIHHATGCTTGFVV